MKFNARNITLALIVCTGLGLTSAAFIVKPAPAPAAPEVWHERDYQAVWAAAHHGKTEVRLPDAARIDIVTDTHAIEVDYAKKWGEAIGQALYYAAETGKTPGILLIIAPDGSDDRYVRRIRRAAEYWQLPIDLYFINKRGDDL